MTDQPAAPPPTRDQFAAPLPQTRGGASKVIAGVGVLAVVALAVVAAFVVGNVLFADDPTRDAKAGDCLANLPQAVAGEETSVDNAKVVACDSPDARFSVVGRVDGVTAGQASVAEVCAAHPDATMRFYAVPPGGKGYVLCLKPA